MRAGLPAYRKKPARTRSFKTQQRTKTNVEVDVILGELKSRTEAETSINGFNAYRNEFPDSLERR